MCTCKKISLVLAVFSLLASTTQAGEVVDDTVNLDGNREATWYLPDATPTGWIFLQHGFSCDKTNFRDLSTNFMDSGLMVLTINCNVSGGNPNLALKIADALIDNPPTPPNGFLLPDRLVLAGHSAGGLFVTYMGGRLVEREYTSLVGTILLDPVDKNNGMNPNMQDMVDSGLPVLAILANSHSCNDSNNAMQPLRNLSVPFVGIQLTDESKHTDAQGANTNWLGGIMCGGAPKEQNINFLQDFASHWAVDMVNDSQTPAYYPPSGEKIKALCDQNDGQLIKEWSGPSCGNGQVEEGEDCDGSDCCTADCTFRASDFECHPAISDCDIAEYCNSHVATCPADEFVPDGTVCLDDGTCQDGQCVASPECGNEQIEEGEDCDGGNCCTYNCTFRPADFECRGETSECDVAEYCDGQTATCPEDVFLPNGKPCSEGVCQNGICRGWIVIVQEDDLQGEMDSEWFTTMKVPLRATTVEIVMSGGFWGGNADLYVKKNAPVSKENYDCRSANWWSNERCNFESEGTYNIMVHGKKRYSGASLEGRYYLPEP